MKGRTFLLVALGYLTLVLGCDECGDECKKVCGTKQFKTCCFNYLRKRSMVPETGPDLRLEVSLAKNRQSGEIPSYMAYLAPLFQYSSAINTNLRSNARNTDPNDQGMLQLLYDA